MTDELKIIQTDGQTCRCTKRDFPNFQKNGWKIIKEPTTTKSSFKVKEDKSGK